MEVILDKMKRRYGVEVDLAPPPGALRERLSGRRPALKAREKQTGVGQFGDCGCEWSRWRGAKGTSSTMLSSEALSRNFIPAVEKGIVEALDHGVVAGFPVVDVKVKLYDGSYHAVDSSELAFKLGGLAWQKAMGEAAPVLLEPVMNVEVTAPEGEHGGRSGRSVEPGVARKALRPWAVEPPSAPKCRWPRC